MKFNQLMHYNPLLGRSLLDLDLDQLMNYGDQDLELSKNTWLPAVDIKETEKEFIVQADVPGMSKENIDVSMDNHVLTIQGKREFEKKEEKKNFIRTERFQGEFYRRFTLPEIVDAENISANCQDGVLMITIPKRIKDKKSNYKKIKVN